MKHNFKNLEAWKRAKAVVKTVYKLTSAFPAEEKFGLALQMRKASISIPSNIAEGIGRNSNKDLSRFFDLAIGSSCELETQLQLSNDLEFLDKEQIEPLIEEITEIRKMMIGFQRKVLADHR